VETPNTNRLPPVSGHPYTYDAAGNLTADYNLTYAYDPFNMLREKDSGIYFSKSEFYIYTASDERIGVKYGNVIESPTIWSIRDFSGNVLRQYEGYDQMPGMSWLWIEDYMYRDGQLLAGERVPEEGGRRHFHLDHLGSPRLVTGDDSKEMSEHDYEPFGLESNPLYQETAGGFDREDPKRFTGHERDYTAPPDAPASAYYLDYMHARFYAPSVGRFLSVDPVLVKAAVRAPQMWNRYSYVGNNPMVHTDPTGKYICTGSKDDCATFAKGLADAKTALAGLSADSPGRAKIEATLKFYGDEGKRNGVKVSFTTDKSVVANTGTAGFWIFKTTTVTMNLGNIAAIVAAHPGSTVGAENAATAVHEGTHGIDERNGVPLRTRPDELGFERRAYDAQAYVNQGLGVDSAWGMWTTLGGFNPARIEAAAQASTDEWCKDGCPP